MAGGGNVAVPGGAPEGGTVGSLGGDSQNGGGGDEVAEPESGGAGGAAGSGPLFTSPAEFDGLRLWLEAAPESWSGAGGAEADAPAVWTDRSGYGNDAVSSTDSPPLLVLGGANGRPAFRFGPQLTTLTIADAPSLRFGVDPFVLVLVMRWRNSATPVVEYYGTGYIIDKTEASYPFTGLLLCANYPQLYLSRPAMTRFAAQLEYGSAFALTGATGLNDDHFRVFTVRRSSGTELELRVNGKFDARTMLPSTLNVSAAGIPLVLGGVPNAAFDGDIAQLVAIAGPVTDEALGALERSLMEEYSL